MTPPEPISADLLLEHAAFLRGLARSLVVDEARAEDVVQEAYLAALRKPPPPHVRLKAWLAAVTRNLALRSRRTEGRIRRRERGRGGPPAVAATEDVAARLEAQRRIADAVSELSEPGRRAVVHRYFDGKKPAEIARTEGVPVRTIESRLRRAREALREKLDKAYGGSRGAWVFILAPTVGLTLEAIGASSASAATGSLATSATSATSAAVSSAAPGAASSASSAAFGAAMTGVTLMSTKVVIGVAAACVAGAFFAGWQLKTPASDGDLASGKNDRTAARDAPQLTNDRALLEKAQRELVAEKEQRAALEAELEALRTKVAAAEPAPTAPASAGPDATSRKPGAAQFRYHAVQEALDQGDWKELGTAVTKLVPLLGGLKDALIEGRLPANVGELQRWNAPLLEFALKTQGQIPATSGLNGAFTHPSVMANLVYSALAQSSVPLDEAQVERLKGIGDRYVAEDARRIAAYPDDTIAFQKAVDEAAHRKRFYDEVDALLTAEQRDVLHPAATKGLIGVDIFSSGLLWDMKMKGVPFTDRSDLATGMTASLLAVGIEAEHKDVVEAAVGDWARGLSDQFLASTYHEESRAATKLLGGRTGFMMPEEIARVASEQQLPLLRALLDRLPPDGASANVLRTTGVLFLPLKNPGK